MTPKPEDQQLIDLLTSGYAFSDEEARGMVALAGIGAMRVEQETLRVKPDRWMEMNQKIREAVEAFHNSRPKEGGAMKTKHTYVVESLHNGKWIELFENTRDYCLGYVSHVQYCAPRKAYRIVRSDGKVMKELPAAEDCSIGMVAGWPTPEQYEGAAQRALEQAARIRRQREKTGNYHDNTR